MLLSANSHHVLPGSQNPDQELQHHWNQLVTLMSFARHSLLSANNVHFRDRFSTGDRQHEHRKGVRLKFYWFIVTSAAPNKSAAPVSPFLRALCQDRFHWPLAGRARTAARGRGASFRSSRYGQSHRPAFSAAIVGVGADCSEGTAGCAADAIAPTFAGRGLDNSARKKR